MSKKPSFYLERVKPDTANQKLWDKVFVVLLMIFYTCWFLIMPLDASRFQLTQSFPVWLEVVGGILLLPSAFLFIMSYIDNPYLSGVVKIQEDRGQKVVSTGVYGFVRHPMYLGAVLLFVGTPMILGFLIGFGFAILFVIGIIYRIFGEEKILELGLGRYLEYKGKVRVRLIPYIW